MDVMSTLQTLYSLARQIYTQVQQVKINQHQCQRLAERVHIVEEAIQGLERAKRQQQYAAGLRDLVGVLKQCLSLVQMFAEGSWFKRVLKAGTHDATFRDLAGELQQSLQVLNLGLAAQQMIDQAQDEEAVLADAVLIQAQHQEIIRLQQAHLAGIQGMKLQAEEQQAVVLLQLASLRGQLARLAQPTPVVVARPGLMDLPRIPYYDLVFEEKIATGAATVYRGRWEGQVVAIKTLTGMLSPTEQAQFEREVLIMGSLRHPHITTCYGFCLEDGQACLVMEYMAEGTLRTFLNKGRLSLEAQRTVALGIAQGLHHLHQKGFLHRDLTSAHLLVNAQGEAKLSDFGLSKSSTAAIQTTPKRSPALAFQAPECIGHQTYTAASDIYSFGVVLWEILTGQAAHSPSAEGAQRYAKAGVRETIPAEVPAPLAALLQACWSLEPLERPAASALVSQLEAYKPPVLRAASPTAEQWFEVAQQHEREKQFETAFQAYHQAADKGHLKAKTSLGLFFVQGLGTACDKRQAHQYFLAGAEGGHPRAMYNLARMYEKGDGVRQDYGTALTWYQKAQAAGHGEATQKVRQMREMMESLESSPLAKIL